MLKKKTVLAMCGCALLTATFTSGSYAGWECAKSSGTSDQRLEVEAKHMRLYNGQVFSEFDTNGGSYDLTDKILFNANEQGSYTKGATQYDHLAFFSILYRKDNKPKGCSINNDIAWPCETLIEALAADGNPPPSSISTSEDPLFDEISGEYKGFFRYRVPTHDEVGTNGLMKAFTIEGSDASYGFEIYFKQSGSSDVLIDEICMNDPFDENYVI